MGALAVSLSRLRVAGGPRWALGALVALMRLVGGLGGTISVLLWQFSALEGMGPNENWFVVSPLTILLMPFGWRLARGKGRSTFWSRATALIGGLALLGLVLQPVLPQDNLDVMGVFVPFMLVVAWLGRQR